MKLLLVALPLVLASACRHRDPAESRSSVVANGAPAIRVDELSAADRSLGQLAREWLSRDVAIDPRSRNITVTAHDGTLTLRGSVIGESDKRTIENNLNELPGVLGCDNQLEVE